MVCQNLGGAPGRWFDKNGGADGRWFHGQLLHFEKKWRNHLPSSSILVKPMEELMEDGFQTIFHHAPPFLSNHLPSAPPFLTNHLPGADGRWFPNQSMEELMEDGFQKMEELLEDGLSKMEELLEDFFQTIFHQLLHFFKPSWRS